MSFTQLFFRWPSRPEPPRAESGNLEPEKKLEARARRLLREIGCRELAASLKVVWNPRLRSTAGLASYSNCTIALNPYLAQFGETEVEATLRHELAHLVAKFRAGRRRIAPHGPEWKKACIDLGLPGEKRCHNLPLPQRQVARKHFYQCPSCLVEVRRVRPFRARVACLECCRKYSRGQYDERFRLVKVVP